MARSLKSAILCLALCAAAGPAFAGASQAPIDFTPDPALRIASRSDLEARIGKACRVTQAKLQQRDEATFARPCGCYASRSLRSLDEAELLFYREKGFFNDGARAKALAALDACRLQRPF